MECIHCGKKLESDSKFCIHCGESQQITQQSYKGGNLIPFEENYKWGFKDRSTREIIIPPRYYSANEIIENRALVEISGKYGFIDENGNKVIPLKYEMAYDYKNGFARVSIDSLWAYIDKAGKQIVDFKYDNLEDFINEIAIVCLGNKYGLIDSSGKDLTKIEFDNIEEFGETCLKVKINSQYGLLDSKGKQLVTIEFEELYFLSDCLLKVKKEGKYGILHTSGNIILENIYDSIETLDDSYFLVKDPGKVGIANQAGKITIQSTLGKLRILPEQKIAIKEKSNWKCYDLEGNELDKKDKTFRKFRRQRARTRSLTLFLSLISLFILVGFYDFKTDSIGLAKSIQIILIGDDEYDWRNAINEYKYPRVEPLEKYLNEHPIGKYYKIAMEEILYVRAISNNNLNDYKEYAGLYPNGEHILKVKLAIEDLEWGLAKDLNSKRALNSYIEAYPNGRYINNAKRLFNKIIEYEKELYDWNIAKLYGTIESYISYLDNYPEGSFFREGIKSLEKLTICNDCNGTGKCQKCNGTSFYGKERKLFYDLCPRYSNLFHGKNCKKCGGDGRVNEHYEMVDADCRACINGKCDNCKGVGKIKNGWLENYYALKAGT